MRALDGNKTEVLVVEYLLMAGMGSNPGDGFCVEYTPTGHVRVTGEQTAEGFSALIDPPNTLGPDNFFLACLKVARDYRTWLWVNLEIGT